MRHLTIYSSLFLLASLGLVACTGIDHDQAGSALHPSHIWSFTSAAEITNAFRGRSVSLDLVATGASEFLVVSEQYRSTPILDSVVYERFAPDFWHLRGVVSSYSQRDIVVRSVLTNGVLSLYRDQSLQAQFMSTAEQEMSERQGVR